MNFDALFEMTNRAAKSAQKTASELAGKGKKQVDLLNAQNKLSKAEKQLGALVYSLKINGEQNDALVDKYVQEIADIEKEITALKEQAADVNAPQTEESGSETETDNAEAEAPESARKCPQCGETVEADALFCNHCGAQL